MRKSILKFDMVSENIYHTIFRNNHGRKIYLRINCIGETITISDCLYIDRPMRNGSRAIPQKWTTTKCNYSSLIDVLAKELDKHFYGMEFSEKKPNETAEEYITHYLQNTKKYKFLILVEYGDILKTRLKNRVYRTINLEIRQNGYRGLIQNCYYCDRRYKGNNQLITPVELKTIYFDYNTEKVLEIVNNELNCDFTDVIITRDTFNFEKSDIPICGSI